jgi:hypothetical protein
VNLTRKNVKKLIQKDDSKLKGTIFIPTDPVSGSDASLQSRTRLKNALQSIEAHVNYDKKELKPVVDELARLEKDSNFWEYQDNGLALFFDSEGYEYFKLPVALPEAVFLLDRYIASPLLIALESNVSFYLLDVNLTRPRLFYGSGGKLKQVEVDLMPGSFEDEVGRDEYLRQLQHQTGGVSGFHGHSEEEAINEDTRRYLKKIAEATERHLQDKDEPLLLAGTENRTGNIKIYLSYGHLITDSLHGNYEKHNESQLADEVYERIKRYFDKQTTQLVEELTNTAPEYVVIGTKEVLEAAISGRVGSLYLPVYRTTADINSNTNSNSNSNHKILLELPSDVNSFDGMVVEVFNQGGKIIALDGENYPEFSEAKALCRY